MALPELQTFVLVGGTALALQVGHRTSEDIDLFSVEPFALDELEYVLASVGNSTVVKRNSVLMQGYIDGVKVDLVKYPTPLIRPIVLIEGIRMASVEDITAMKLKTVAGRGAKRDFYDLHFLFNLYGIDECLRFFVERYGDNAVFAVLRSLCYFEDAENQPMPRVFTTTPWAKIKKDITKTVNSYLKNRQ